MMAAALTLLRTGLFDDLPDTTVAAVAARAEQRTVPPGTVIVREGDPGDAFFVVLEGTVVVHTTAPDGARVELDRQGPGTHFGEQALLRDDGVRSATVTALDTTRLLRLPAAVLSELVAQAPTLRTHLQSLGQRYLENRLARRSSLVRALVAGAVSHREHRCAPGEVVARADTPADHAFVVVHGGVVLHEVRDGAWVRLRRLGPGLTFGQAPTHRYTAIAEVETLLWRVPHAALSALHAESPELGPQLGAVRERWVLPQRGVVTQVVGELDGRPCIDQHYALDDGRTVVASHVLGDATLHVSTLGLATPHTLATPDGHLTLTLDDGGRVRGLCARAPVPQVDTAVGWVLDGHLLPPADRAALARTGTIAGADDRLACTCLQVPDAVARAHFADGSTLSQLQRQTGAGTVCGTCVPTLRALAGDRAFLPVVLDSVSTPTDDVRRLVLRHRDARPLPRARPGQHIVLRVLVDGQTLQRSYTLTQAPGAPWTLLVKVLPGGRLGAWLRTHARPGVALEASVPAGTCVWEGGPAPVLLFVAGIGITPALAMARTLVAQGWPHRMVIDWSVRTRAHAALGSDLDPSPVPNLDLRIRVTETEPRLAETDVRAWVARFPSAVAFVCGPDGYQAAVRGWLVRAGLPDARIHVESFRSPT